MFRGGVGTKVYTGAEGDRCQGDPEDDPAVMGGSLKVPSSPGIAAFGYQAWDIWAGRFTFSLLPASI